MTRDAYDLPVYEKANGTVWTCIQKISVAGRIVSAYVLDRHGLAAAVCQDGIWKQAGCENRASVWMREKRCLRQVFGDILAEVPADRLDQIQASHYGVVGDSDRRAGSGLR